MFCFLNSSQQVGSDSILKSNHHICSCHLYFEYIPTLQSRVPTTKLFLQVGHELPPPHDVFEKLDEAEAPAFHS